MTEPLPKSADAFVQRLSGKVEREVQGVQHRAFTAAPLAVEIPEKGFVLARISSVTYIYTKVDGKVSRAALTDV